jgi:SHS2 domain-containing protein
LDSEPRWEHFSHEADIGVRGRGRRREEAFEQAALALCAVVTDPDGVRLEREVQVHCSAPDDDLLLFDWLNELIAAMSERRMVFGGHEVRIEGRTLRGKAWGEPVEPARHQPAVEVKGATFTGLRVAREPDGTWVAECVVDV